MTVPSDPYSFVNLTTADAEQVNARFAPLYAALAGLDVDNFLDAIPEKLGLTDGATIRRGKCIVSAAESRNDAAYGLLGTPDRVSSVSLATDGLICVAYQAAWFGSGNARAAIFLGANQLKGAVPDSVPVVQEATHPGGGTPRYNNLATTGSGLATSSGTAADVGDPATTGQVVALTSTSGGVATIFASAGMYDVSVRFKTTGVDAVTVKNRRLWVWTVGF